MKINTSLLRYLILLLVVVTLFSLGIYFGWNMRYSTRTNDAFVHAHVIAITPQDVSGHVISVDVSDYAEVKKGQVLFRIDPRTYEDRLHQAEANLQITKDRMSILEEDLKNAELSLTTTQAGLQEKEEHYRENLALAKKGYVSPSVLISMKADYVAAMDVLNQAKQNLLSAQHSIGGSVHGVNAHILAAESSVALAKRFLDETVVRAPVDGIIVNNSLRVGDYVQPGISHLAMINPQTWEIYAYYQETAVGKLHIGEKMKIKLFMYPDQIAEGRIIAIERGSTRNPLVQTSGLRYVDPQEEWILLPQRFLVYIDFDWPYQDKPLQVGATAHVTAE